MPELPEVETVTNSLKKAIQGKNFRKIEVFIPKIRLPLELHREPSLLNRKIVSVRRRARYIIIELSNQHAIVIHLGMSGSIRVTAPEEKRRKHEHVVFHLDNDNTMRFDCPRRFGFVISCLLNAPGCDPNDLRHLGPEPLSRNFTGKYLQQQLQSRRLSIKSAIMDNRIVVGVGNIYANESLFLSGIDPGKPAEQLSPEQCKQLVREIKQVLRRAIKAGGTTVIDFKGLDGSEGEFARQLQIYGKADEPCGKCKTIIETTRIGGRSTYFCPNCQS